MTTGRTVKKGEVLRRLLVFLICLNAALPSAYLTVTKVDLHDAALGGASGDAAQYVRMFQGVGLEQIPKPFRYRILTPYLARLVPFPPAALTGGYEVSPDKIVMFRFAMVNVVGLAATGLIVHLLCEALGFGVWESLAGSLLFMTGFTVVNFGAAPMVDALSFLFLAAAILCVLRGWSAGLLLSVLVGMFARETTAYVLLPILALAGPARTRVRNVLLCLPGLAAYLVFRLVLWPTSTGWNYGVADTLENLRVTFTSARRLAWVATDGGLAFGVLWILALIGWWSLVRRREWRHPLFRLSFLIPFALVIPNLIYANIGRLFTLAFPAVIPLALLPLRRVIGGAREEPPADTLRPPPAAG
jgi:hypothetical protein